MERNFKPTDLISVLLLYVYVADGFRIAVAKGKITVIWLGYRVITQFKYVFSQNDYLKMGL